MSHSKHHTPETCCADADLYKIFFRAFYWHKNERKKKNPRNERNRRVLPPALLDFVPSLLHNPSQFAVFANVRRTIHARWSTVQNHFSDGSEDSDSDDNEQTLTQCLLSENKVAKITTIGLHTVFNLISTARVMNSYLCEQALNAMLDIIQGFAPEDLGNESNDLIQHVHSTLIDLCKGTSIHNASPATINENESLISTATSSLVALSVARGDTELVIKAAAELIMCQDFAEQLISVPSNLHSLQRSVLSLMLGIHHHNLHKYGVPVQTLVTTFQIDLPSKMLATEDALIIKSLTTDGLYLYLYTSKGLLKVGSGYGGTIKQHVYYHKEDFFYTEKKVWMGHINGSLYLRFGKKGSIIQKINKEKLTLERVIHLDFGENSQPENKSVFFSDGHYIGTMFVTEEDVLHIKMFNPDDDNSVPLKPFQDRSVNLQSLQTISLGWTPYEELDKRRIFKPYDVPVATHIQDCDDDKIRSVHSAQDFSILRTASGKVYYTGKSSSLGYRVPSPSYGRWTIIQETAHCENEADSSKLSKIVQVAVGHEGYHAILVVDDGSVLFVGLARRGEDGATNKRTRVPVKATKPKPMTKAEKHHVVFAACNNGSSALVTQQGLLLMFGKDSQHADASGVVIGLSHEHIVQVALGKAHAVALTIKGDVYTFGLNNKGQCGNEFVNPHPDLATQSSPRICPQLDHSWERRRTRICTSCGKCTGVNRNCKWTKEKSDKPPGQLCECGPGDMGCTKCGICFRCAADQAKQEAMLEGDEQSGASGSEGAPMTEVDKESKSTSTSLSPAQLLVPSGQKIKQIACGLHHSVLLTEKGAVYTFGWNLFGQLGTGDTVTHHEIVRVQVPPASGVAAGSNHTVVQTVDGALYTFGNYQKGALGRSADSNEFHYEEVPRTWYATPGLVTLLGPPETARVVWITATGDQTYAQVSTPVIKSDTFANTTVVASNDVLLILPNKRELHFKCISINKFDLELNRHIGNEQVDFAKSITCYDQSYDVLWSFIPEYQMFQCYNNIVFNGQTLQKCSKYDYFEDFNYEGTFTYPNCGSFKKITDFKDLDTIENLCVNSDHMLDNRELMSMSVLNQELAIPVTSTARVTRLHCALHLLGCLDTLNYAQECCVGQIDCKCEYSMTIHSGQNKDFHMVKRFETQGSGWGYNKESVEAVCFSVNTQILLGGFGLYGGRGNYSAKIRVYDLGMDGVETDADVEPLSEYNEIDYTCVNKETYPVLFETPVHLFANRWYLAWAKIIGPSSDCGANGQPIVVTPDAVFNFKNSIRSTNGTDVHAGQIPTFLFSPLVPNRSGAANPFENGELPLMTTLSMKKNISVECFRMLIKLLKWAWHELKLRSSDARLVPVTYEKLVMMKHLDRLAYIVRACMRMVKFYLIEIYPSQPKKKLSNHLHFADIIEEAKNAMLAIMSDNVRGSEGQMGKGKGKSYTAQFQIELIDSALRECHKTMVAAFYAFFSTPVSKWTHLCSLLYQVKNNTNPMRLLRDLAATMAALCISKNLREIILYTTISSDGPAFRESQKSAEKDQPGSSKQGTSTSWQDSNRGFHDWTLIDLLPPLLRIAMLPTKTAMLRLSVDSRGYNTAPLLEQTAEYSCKLMSRVVSELIRNTTDGGDETRIDDARYHLTTPSRFARVNQNRSWTSGDGAADAIAFVVDRPGVILVGVGLYGGVGTFRYDLDLLVDRDNSEDRSDEYSWKRLSNASGTYNSIDCSNDIAVIKFDQPVPLNEGVQYAIRLSNYGGGRTCNGDNGLTSVVGPDGTIFKFYQTALSLNGTSLSRGQIPTLVYYMSSAVHKYDDNDETMAKFRSIAVRFAAEIVAKSADMLTEIRDKTTSKYYADNHEIVNNSPVVRILLPFLMSNLSKLEDAKSLVSTLNMINKILPAVTSANALEPNIEPLNAIKKPYTTSTENFVKLEKNYPYKEANICNMRVMFPSTVSWIVVELDPFRYLAQLEDTLTVYGRARGPKRHHCHCGPGQFKDCGGRVIVQRPLEVRPGEACVLKPPSDERVCLEYDCMYIALTKKMSRNIMEDWPQQAFLVPGNEVVLSLETASDYLKEFRKNDGEEGRLGFRAFVFGFEDVQQTIGRNGMNCLEMELAYLGGLCASKLLSPHLEMPFLTPEIVTDFHTTTADAQSNPTEEILSAGLDITSLPTVDEVVCGSPLRRFPRFTYRLDFGLF